MKKKLFILLIFLLATVTMAMVSASDNATDADVAADDTGDEIDLDEDSSLKANEEEVIALNDSGNPDTKDDINQDTNGTDSVVNETGNNTNDTADENLTGNESLPDSNKTTVKKKASALKVSDVVGYTSFKSKIVVKLTSDKKPLASKKIKITLNGKTYKRTTNKKGEATLEISLPKGSYTVKYSYAGDNKTKAVTAKSKIKFKESTKTRLKLGDKDINYRQGSKCLFYVKLVDNKGKAIKKQIVYIKVNGKTYKVKTNKYGNAKVFLNLKKGTYKVKYSFKKTLPYLSSSGSAKIKFKEKLVKGDGYWLWPAHMHSVNLKSLASKGTKNVLLHVQAISVYGKSGVESFIRQAHRYGIKVHLWMQVAYTGGVWYSLVDDHGKIKYSFLNNKVKEAKRYAKIKGVDGIHFDYVRYGGTAHKHPNAVKSVNYFTKKASVAVHKIKPNCIVSAALMPEPSAMHYYYGQDVASMSKYMDVLLPMVYKGNYHQNRAWIKSVTKTFSKQSNGAQIWTGLQSYYSDNNVNKLPHSTLLKDAKAAKKGGATGIILFRIGISCNFNFKKV